MTHATERKGSPQTLVCTKTRATYQRRCEQYRKDIKALAKLAQLAARCSGSAAALGKVKDARKLASEWVPT
jgi:hypothetical protein